MNTQNEDSDLLSVCSSEIQETFIEDATEAFLSAATEGNVELLTRLYESETKVEKECHIKCHIRHFSNINMSYKSVYLRYTSLGTRRLGYWRRCTFKCSQIRKLRNC